MVARDSVHTAEPMAGDGASAIEAKLKTLFAQRRTIPAGRLQFINLGPIREKFGKHWPTIADRANAMATTIVNRSLTRADMVIALDELTYLLLFGVLSEQEAQVKCGLIASEISRHLLGEDTGLEYAEIQTVVVGAEAAQAGAELSLEDLVRQISGKADDAARSAATAPVPSDEHVDDVAEVCLEPGGIRFIYRPLWDVKRNVLSTYLCIPRTDQGAGNVERVGYAILGGTENPEHVFSLDLACLDRVRFDLENLERQKRKLLVGCPVHYETLRSSRRRLAYLERCGRLKTVMREFLIFEVAGIPDDVPQTRLLELLAPLVPYSRARMVRVPITRLDFDALTGAHIHAVGVDLSETSRGESELFVLFNKFAHAAGRAKLRIFVHGLRSVSLATAAVCAGFDYVDGDAVKSATFTPDSVYRFRSIDLFRALRS